MKKTFSVVALFLVATMFSVSYAQRNNRDDRSGERVERQAKALAKELKLNDDDATVFTRLYVEYQDTLRSLRTLQPRSEKEDKSKQITDGEADQQILASIESSRREAELKQAYYAKFREHFTPSQLVRVFVRMPMAPSQLRDRNGNRPSMPGGPGFGGPGFGGGDW